ncbi:MAG: hypothetical protein ACRD3B_11630 [Candidatus Sulfotelmatobacter sp.]
MNGTREGIHMRKGLVTAGLQLVLAFTMLLTAVSTAQTPHATPAAAPNPAQLSQKDVAELQDQLLEHLRVSPTLAEVVARDPSLLSNAEYVNRSNPELGRFLQEHPEIAQNPDYYLFNNLHGQNEQPAETLERKLWPAMSSRQDNGVARDLVEGGLPLLAFICFLGVVLWLTQVLLENRRWNRIFKLQSDVHAKLIERFGTSQEVLTYMNTDAGKRFLEATPISVGLDRQAPVPSPVARVLTPLQIGIVLSLLGVGLIFLRHSIPDGDAPLLLVGTVVLMPGLGFIISAGITWVLAKHLGLMPQTGTQSGEQG